MSKGLPEQQVINSMFDSVTESDLNASVALDILSEEFDFSGARRVMIVPDEKGQKMQASDQLDLYLHCVYHGGEKTLNLLLEQGYDHRSVSSAPDEGHLIVFQESNSLKEPLVISRGNDVCWAVLSDEEGALSKLERAYADHGITMEVNRREAEPLSMRGLRNADARKHTPLDLAVMLYIAQKRMDKQTHELIGQRAEAIREIVQPIVERFQQAGAHVGKVELMPRGSMAQDMQVHAPVTEKNIRLLLSHGAKGSVAAYFPASDQSLAQPFSDGHAFEVMSLKEFCRTQAEHFSPSLLSALTGGAAGPDVRPDPS